MRKLILRIRILLGLSLRAYTDVELAEVAGNGPCKRCVGRAVLGPGLER